MLAAREAHAAGRIDAAALTAAEDAAIVDVIALQQQAGLRSATDGEFRRASWHMDFIYALDGVSKAEDNLAVHFKNAEGGIDFTPAALKVDGRLGIGETIFGESFAFLRDHVAGRLRRPSRRSRRPAWCTTAAARPRSIPPSIRTWTGSGPT